jgi:uncharacterized protein (TIGR03437 family)
MESSRPAALAVILVVLSQGGFATAAVYPGFSSLAGLNLSGSATITTSSDGAVLRLTPAQVLQAGSAFSATTVSVARFSTFFQFRLTQPGFFAADGLVFVIQPGAAGVGGVGGLEGYGGITQSVGVEFDTLQNDWDPNNNHIGIIQNGDVTMYLGTGPYTPNTLMANGDLWSVWIDYDGATMQVRVADGSSIRPANPVAIATINLAEILGQTTAHLGFTAGTGTYFQNQDIIDWQFNDTCAVSLASSTASFTAAGGSGAIPVTAASNCSWTVLTDASWIHATSGTSAVGNGLAAYAVDVNTGGSRSGTIQAGEQTFVVSQASAGPPPPAIKPGGVSDPWNYTLGVSPGAWVSIFGSNLANVTQSWSPLPGQALPTVLGGVTVTIDGIAAPLAYVSPTLVNALVPAAVRQGQVLIVVTNQGLASSPYAVQSSPFLPAVYSNPVPGSSPPRYYITAVDPFSGELLGLASVDPRVSRKVNPGDTIDLFALGLGTTTPQFPTDTYFSGVDSLTSTFMVMVGGTPINPSFAGLVAPGLYQVRITVPTTTAPGDQPLWLDFGSARSAANVYLSIQ